jgi:hypothetical protein
VNPENQALKSKLEDLLGSWKAKGLPGRQTLMDIARDLLEWKKTSGITGLWPVPPVFATATLDDAWGHGLEVIGEYAKVLGMKMVPLGLEKSAGEIVSACHELQPDYLGMTILQFDSEEDLFKIGKALPKKVKIIAGGPVFKSDPDLAGRTGVHYAAKDLAGFLKFFLPQQ